jgi:hypothetical protein
VSWQEWDEYEPSPPRFNNVTTHDTLRCVVPTFGENVWLDGPDKFKGRVLLKPYYSVDASEAQQNHGSSPLILEGATRPFQAGNTGITVEAHHKRIADCFHILQVFDMPGMQQIEAAIGEAQNTWPLWESFPVIFGSEEETVE